MNIGRQRCPKLIVHQTQRSILNILHFALDYILYEFHEDSDKISKIKISRIQNHLYIVGFVKISYLDTLTIMNT